MGNFQKISAKRLDFFLERNLLAQKIQYLDFLDFLDR